MRSNANFKTHPIHPMLIPFPQAFLVGAFIFDVLFVLARTDGFQSTAYYLSIAGLCAGVIAAVPGVLDYMKTVPPKSSAKKRAAKHGITNGSALILFGAALWLKVASWSDVAIISMELGGVVLLVTAGWMGGTLVYRNQIGVDIRYADAGKWRESHLDDTKEIFDVAEENELATNQMKLLHIQGNRIVLAKTEDGYVAFDDRCTHKGGSLVGGAMICGTVQCPWHGSQFNVKTGNVSAGPAKENIRCYPVEKKNGKILVHFRR